MVTLMVILLHKGLLNLSRLTRRFQSFWFLGLNNKTKDVALLVKWGHLMPTGLYYTTIRSYLKAYV
jgi:hypothetical protein